MNKFVVNYQLRYISPKQLTILFFLFLILIISVILSIKYGALKIDILEIITDNKTTLYEVVFLEVRLPRVFLSCFVGASLGLSGASLQGLFRNPLADPGLIGVSAGAALGATFSIVIGSSFVLDSYFGKYLIPISAVIGSISIIMLLYVSTKGFSQQGISYMLLIGIAVNAFASVGIAVLTFISSDLELRNLSFWLMGSFGGSEWVTILPGIMIITLSIAWMINSSRELDILQLGESEASRLGIDVKKIKFKVILSSAITVGISVSLSGMISFVGLVIPHIVRLLGGVNHSYLLIGSALSGAALMSIADLNARFLIQPAEIPIGLITSALGAPIFLWLVLRSRKK